jgi:hypothetical protein
VARAVVAKCEAASAGVAAAPFCGLESTTAAAGKSVHVGSHVRVVEQVLDVVDEGGTWKTFEASPLMTRPGPASSSPLPLMLSSLEAKS